MKKFIFLLTLVVGCLQPPATQTDQAQQWVAPEDLKVSQELLSATGETIILVDLSASNSFRDPMFTEVLALVESVDEQAQVCVLQISEDSRSTGSDPWCRGLVDAFTCTHPEVKTAHFANSTKEKPAYAAAGERIKREMVTCEVEHQQDMARRRATAKAGLKAWIKTARTTQWTDLQGAVFRARAMSKVSPGTIWIYSDMEDDPDPSHKRGVDLTVDLATWYVNVRQIRKTGAGYSTSWQTKWEALFTSWGNPTVEWKDFFKGEFSRPTLLEVPLVATPSSTGSNQPISRPSASSGGGSPFPDKAGVRR